MSNKYQQEIEEILKQADEVLPKDRPRPVPAGGKSGSDDRSPSPFRRLFGGGGPKISAGKIFMASIALFLLALVVGAVGILSVVPLVAAGLILFVIAYALFFVKPGSGAQYEKRWRGRVIEERSSLMDRMKRWLRG